MYACTPAYIPIAVQGADTMVRIELIRIHGAVLRRPGRPERTIAVVATIQDVAIETCDRTMRVHARGAFLVLREYARRAPHNDTGARCEHRFWGSDEGAHGRVGCSVSKHGVIGLTRSAAYDLAPLVLG